MTFEQAIDFIESKRHLGSNLGLLRIEKLCALISNPQKKLKFLHVAGTNGKGSVCAFAASALRCAGYKTGLYLSPYLEEFRESMQINGSWISRDELAALTDRMVPAILAMEADGLFPTEYEIGTALAFLFFAENGCDIVVLETGLGGALDATNVIDAPLVSIITSISLDHTKILGETLEKIALVKSGIIKKNGTTLCYPLQSETAYSVIAARAKAENNAFILPELTQLQIGQSDIHGTRFVYKGLSLYVPLAGEHQVYNAVTAVETLLLLRGKGFLISDEAIAEGLLAVHHPARQEILLQTPLVLLDGAHNAEGAASLAASITHNITQKPLVMIMGILADKDFETAIAFLAPLCDSFIAVRPPNPRALAPEITAKTAAKYCSDTHWAEDYGSAVALAFEKCGRTGAIVICGSLYQVSALREAVRRFIP